MFFCMTHSYKILDFPMKFRNSTYSLELYYSAIWFLCSRKEIFYSVVVMFAAEISNTSYIKLHKSFGSYHRNSCYSLRNRGRSSRHFDRYLTYKKLIGIFSLEDDYILLSQKQQTKDKNRIYVDHE